MSVSVEVPESSEEEAGHVSDEVEPGRDELCGISEDVPGSAEELQNVEVFPEF